MDLSIIIVAFRGYPKLKDTIDAVLASETSYSYEVVVVDNGSGDGTADCVARDYPPETHPMVKLIRNENNGFSKGNNIGFKQTVGKDILILNPDTGVQPDTIQKCMDYLHAHPDIGALGCKLIKADGTLDPACRRSFPNLLNSFSRFIGLAKLFPKNKKLSSYNLGYTSENEIMDVDALSGAFMLIPRTVFEKVHCFDEDYFMYGEDLDLCWNIKHAGYHVVYYPETFTYHYKGQSSRKTPYISLYNFHAAMWIFYKKHYAKASSAVVNGLVYSGIWGRFALLLTRNYFRKNPYVSK
jgi:GT2 family glycosyltransferase